MKNKIRIGTRASELALWQAHLVENKLNELGYETEIVEVSSTGDEVLDKPLHQIGGMGLFTRTLDNAMLRGEIDIAVHSLKDVPTDLPEKIVQAAVLERANILDVLVFKNNTEFLKENSATIATGSLRRRAQWLHKYPNHTITGLRGNVNTRLQKLEDNDWNGAIFAAAGLERINLLPENHQYLDWMIPAPAQGAIMVTALEADKAALEACEKLNHRNTEIAVFVERQFMKVLEGGCTAPIGGNATIENEEIHFVGVLSAIDGSREIRVEKKGMISDFENFGGTCAKELLADGGKELMIEIKAEMKK
ncbi:hydroxymethylbilane synthase [Aureivirga marina]|uniref:hydroxymethylbilane synthase n=1 Tax=Aureivirga marina TaxID=1182451 RepID=UPI0018CAF709|nr:hydroxymethylbilane synthase [Aureivirga marina]